MNYYIQGNAANADKIKAAFNGKGIYSNCNFANENYLYYQCDGKVAFCFIGAGLANIIKTHPDYKELELPVESKFKVGSWLYHNSNGVHPVLVTDYDERHGYQIQDGSGRYHLSRNLTENEYHLWTIQDAKDGDVLVTTKIRSCPFIYRKTNYNNNLAYYYAGIDGDGDFCEGCLKRTLYHFGSVSDVIPATKEQRDLLFAKMKEAGYEWDTNKKKLRKIKPHYDISNFKPFDKVLVRDEDDGKWMAAFYSHYMYEEKDYPYQFATIGTDIYGQCIPFEGNEHLFRTTYMPDEMYINW